MSVNALVRKSWRHCCMKAAHFQSASCAARVAKRMRLLTFSIAAKCAAWPDSCRHAAGPDGKAQLGFPGAPPGAAAAARQPPAGPRPAGAFPQRRLAQGAPTEDNYMHGAAVLPLPQGALAAPARAGVPPR